MGIAADHSPHDSNPYPEITVAVAALLIDSTAVTHIAYGEYLNYLPENAAVKVYQAAQPDGQV